MENTSRKLGPTREDRPALAALAILLKGVFFSREMLSNLGYDRASATRTLRKLSDARVIERTPGGYQMLVAKNELCVAPGVRIVNELRYCWRVCIG